MIIHGTRITERRLGWVADFCPICRTVRPFQLLRLGLVSHIYFVSLGAGKLIGFQIHCAECQTRLKTTEFRHVSPQKRNPDDLVALTAATFPNIAEEMGERLATEKTIRERPASLTPDVRRALIQEPFSILNPALEARSQNTHIDQPIVLGLVATILLLFGALFMAASNSKWGEFLSVALLFGTLCAAVYTVAQLFLTIRRYYRLKTLPNLIRALRPLQPTQEELDEAVARCQMMKLKIGKRTSPDELWSRVHDTRMDSPTLKVSRSPD